MGCAVSLRNSGADDDVLVSVCRERKRLMKSAVDRRYSLAGAHCKYNQSLYAVGLALRLFVSRHSCANSSPFLITFPEPSTDPTLHLHHTPSKPAPAVESEPEEEEEVSAPVCEHFYDDGVADRSGELAVMTSQFGGWDFFNPFDNLNVSGGGYEEGGKLAPEEGGKLAPEEGGGDVKVTVADANVRLGVIDAPLSLASDDNNGRELLEALKDVEDHFMKAYECGVEFSKMLEFNNGNVGPLRHLDFDFLESKESSEKFIPSIAWHKSTLTGSPSCRSLLSSSSRSSSTWTGINSNTTDLFDETGGMESGSHLSTLGRLYAWEKKLYDEVKAGNEMKKKYDQKSSQLSNENSSNNQRTEDEMNDLYSNILVSLKICESISKRIENVRDNELQPQLIELLHGLTKTWKTTLESHKTQSRIMFEVKTFSSAGPSKDTSRNLATLQLEAEIQNWRTCFSNYITTTEAYIETLSEWAYRTISPKNEKENKNTPLVFAVCCDWLNVIKILPDKAVTFAMKRFGKDLRALWAHQGLESQQKRKVDRLVVESEKRVAQLDGFKKRVEIEKAKHEDFVEETRRVILVGFQTGFYSVFDSLTEFCEVCVRKYDDVAEKARSGVKMVSGCVEITEA